MKTFMKPEEVSEEIDLPIDSSISRASLLYIHIPFCESLCPYCSFHRCDYQESLVEEYFNALHIELDINQNRLEKVRSIYIGGGTPTIRMDLLLRLIKRIKTHTRITEVSVETNPNHIQRETLLHLRDAGVTRLSVGIQSFDDPILHHIGRLEKYGTAAMMSRLLAQAEGIISTLNIDLIFNIPIQSDASLHRDIDRILEIGPDQVTFYPLMTAPSVERNLNQMLGPVDYRKEQRQYHIILERMRSYYEPSTAWCFSKTKGAIDEYLVDHEHYLGFGSGSFGYVDGTLHISTFSIRNYIERLNKGRLPISHIKKFHPKERQYYCLLRRMFGLRCDAMQLNRELASLGKGRLQTVISGLRAYGALRRSGNDYTLTPKGMYLWVTAMREFFIAVDTLRDQFREPKNKAREEGADMSLSSSKM